MAIVTNQNTKFISAVARIAESLGFSTTDQTAIDEFGDATILRLTFSADDGRSVVVTSRLGARNSVSDLRVLVSTGRSNEGRAILEALPESITTTLTETTVAAFALAQ